MSTLGKETTVEICSNCHPFYTGKQKLIDTAGRIDKFNRKFQKVQAIKTKRNQEKVVTEVPAKASSESSTTQESVAPQ